MESFGIKVDGLGCRSRTPRLSAIYPIVGRGTTTSIPCDPAGDVVENVLPTGGHFPRVFPPQPAGPGTLAPSVLFSWRRGENKDRILKH